MQFSKRFAHGELRLTRSKRLATEFSQSSSRLGKILFQPTDRFHHWFKAVTAMKASAHRAEDGPIVVNILCFQIFLAKSAGLWTLHGSARAVACARTTE
jgi:hypothetical protein